MSNVVGLTSGGPEPRDLVSIAARIGADVAGPAADDVDQKARFPSEAIEALRRERMLSALIPPAHGGEGATIGDVAAVTTALGQHCASTAMIYAMHQIQVACLVRHGETPYLRRLLEDVAAQELLLASATTEAGVGGDVRSSVCAVEAHGERFRLEKNAPVISYGEHADAILATARRTMDSAPNDQVLVVVHRLAETLEPTSGWDTLGFRGTCSLGFKLRAQGDLGQVLPDPYVDISARTMLPVSHIVWSSVWLGIATSAVNKAGAYVRAEARKKPGTTPPAALRLAELTTVLQQLRSLVRDAVRQYHALMDDPDALSSLGFALQMNNLKVSASTLVVDIVSRSMIICGMAGYREDSSFSLGRHLRDAYGAALMINNDRINANNATMLLVHKDL